MVALGAKSALALLSFALVQPIIKRFNANERLDKQEQVDLYNYQVHGGRTPCRAVHKSNFTAPSR